MVYTYKEILNIYGSRYKVERALKDRIIFKLDRGVYSDKDITNSLVVISKKYEGSIITMDSAFYFYDLTDVIPNKVHIATSRNARKINDLNVIQYYLKDEILNQGKTKVLVNDDDINIYDKERLLIELIRKRASIPFDYYKEIINNYRLISDELAVYKLEEYLSLFKNGVRIFDILQKEVF